MTLPVTTYSSYSSCLTFYAPDIIPRKSMEGHGPSPSPSLRAGALSSFSTLHLYPFTESVLSPAARLTHGVLPVLLALSFFFFSLFLFVQAVFDSVLSI